MNLTAPKDLRSLAAGNFQIQHNAPDVRPHVLLVETEFGAHFQPRTRVERRVNGRTEKYRLAVPWRQWDDV